MASREKVSGNSTPLRPRRGFTDGKGKTIDGGNPHRRAGAKPAARSTSHSEATVVPLPRRRKAAATKSTTAAPQRRSRQVEPTPLTKLPRAVRLSASDEIGQRHPGGAVPSRPARIHATPAKPAARKRPQELRSSASAHSRSATPNHALSPDSSRSEPSRPTDASGRGPWGSVESVVEWLKTHVHQLLDTVRDGAEALTSKVQEWMDTLLEAVANGGAGVKAGLEGVRAILAGKNPVVAAIKGLVSGLSGKAKVAIALVLIFGLLLGPVLLVVLLLALLVAALIAAVRAGSE
ncbi:MAG: hypothetical protein JWR46_1515 [Mycobacterium sp.]|jgi:hypothetical protein|nr:hypothetical protein [Mycobacterium sp.]MDT5311879.1 hypothetical protein [Mycobacterium sp.]